MLTSKGVGFYSYIAAMVFGDTSESVDEVLVRAFLFVSLRTPLDYTINHLIIKKRKDDKDLQNYRYGSRCHALESVLHGLLK